MNKPIEFIRRHPLLAYFALTFALSWGLWIPLQQHVLEGQVALLPLIYLGIFAPALVGIGLSAVLKPGPRQGSRRPTVIAFTVIWILATLLFVIAQVVREHLDLSGRLVGINAVTALLPALVLSSAFSTRPGVRAPVATYVRPRGALTYHVLALCLVPGIWLLGIAVSGALGMGMPDSRYAAVDVRLVGLLLVSLLRNLVIPGLSEEPGWRGFALPRLQARFSPLVASLVLGILWAVWHAPARLGGLEAKSLADTLVEWSLILCVNFIFTWFYNRTQGSILSTVFLHASMNATGDFLPGTLGAIVLLVVAAVLVVVRDQMWKRLPSSHPATYAADDKSS
jgi:membrane protease YdiL (CAAX protease family)